jgi:hypothetical protein
MRRARLVFSLWVLSTAVGPAVACGSRTGLPFDVGEDVTTERDAATDVIGPQNDAHDAALDVARDALPPIDANRRDANRSDCPDADATLVYVLTQQNELFSFYPPTATFTLIGRVACPTSSTPWSMTVNRKGIAYAVFGDGRLFRISTANAACVATPYVAGQNGWTTFGMGYVADTNDPGETLYVSENTFNATSKGLGYIDTTTFTLHAVGVFTPPIPRSELTGTGDGRLFTFYPNDSPALSGSHLSEVDKTDGRLIASNALRVGQPASAFAFAFWGGDFWIFTSPSGPSQVTRYRPSDNTETPISTMPSTIVGAGVSTCAPQQ